MTLYKSQTAYNKEIEKHHELQKSLKETIDQLQKEHQTLLEKDAIYREDFAANDAAARAYGLCLTNQTRVTAEKELVHQDGIYNETFDTHGTHHTALVYAYQNLTEAISNLTSAEKRVQDAELLVKTHEDNLEKYAREINGTKEQCARDVDRLLDTERFLESTWGHFTNSQKFRESEHANLTHDTELERQRDQIAPANATKNEALEKLRLAEDNHAAAAEEMRKQTQLVESHRQDEQRKLREREANDRSIERLEYDIGQSQTRLAASQETLSELKQKRDNIAGKVAAAEAGAFRKYRPPGEGLKVFIEEDQMVQCLIDSRKPKTGKRQVEKTVCEEAETTSSTTTTIPAVEDPLPCEDTSESCGYWAEIGECTNNSDYMHGACPKACDVCPTRPPPPTGAETAEASAPPPEPKCRVEVVEEEYAEETEDSESDTASVNPDEANFTTEGLKAARTQLKDAEEVVRIQKEELAGHKKTTAEKTEEMGSVKKRVDEATKVVGDAQLQQDKANEAWRHANSTVARELSDVDAAKEYVPVCEGYVESNKTKVAEAEKEMKTIGTERTQVKLYLSQHEKKQARIEGKIADVTRDMKAKKSGISGAEEQIKYQEDLIREMNVSIMKDLKKSIDDFLLPWPSNTSENDASMLAGVVGGMRSVLHGAIDFASTAAETFGLAGDAAAEELELKSLERGREAAKERKEALERDLATLEAKGPIALKKDLDAEKQKLTESLQNLVEKHAAAEKDMETFQEDVNAASVVLEEAKAKVLSEESEHAAAVKAQLAAAKEAKETSETVEAAVAKRDEIRDELQEVEKVINGLLEIENAVGRKLAESGKIVAERDATVMEEYGKAMASLADENEWQRRREIASACSIKGDILEIDSVLSFFHTEEPVLKALDSEVKGVRKSINETETQSSSIFQAIEKDKTELAKFLEDSPSKNETHEAAAVVLKKSEGELHGLRAGAEEARGVVDDATKTYDTAVSDFQEVGKSVLELEGIRENRTADFYAAKFHLDNANMTYVRALSERDSSHATSFRCNESVVGAAEVEANTTVWLAEAGVALSETVERERVANKQQVKDSLDGVHKTKEEIEQEARKNLDWEKKVLAQKQLRLDKIDTYCDFPRKVRAKAEAKRKLETSEAGVTSQQKVFDEKVKKREEIESGIHNNTQKIHELMADVNAAQKVHDAQDPADRNRSFVIAY